MAIHICRDFLSLPSTQPSASMYLEALFLFGTLGFTQVGHTAFNISGSLMVASGLSASINFGVTGSFSAVGIPTGSGYVVSATDINRILVLRSDLNPRHNSGLFRISNVLTASNALLVEYRSSEDPPVETNTLKWSIFPSETVLQGPTPYQSTGGTPTGASGYKSRGAYAGKRIILQSPHSSSWQVRYCHESSTDRTNHSVLESMAPGFAGDSAGDFPSGSFNLSAPLAMHLHGPMWFDVSNANYQGTCVGLEASNGTGAGDYSQPATHRLYAWGDSVSGSVVFMRRAIVNEVDAWHSFGMAEEDATLPPLTIQRLFVMGRAKLSDQDVWWDNGTTSNSRYTGMSFGLNNQPVNCVQAMYDYTYRMGLGPKSEALAVDNTILGATELQRVDLWAGTQESGLEASNQGGWPSGAVLKFDPRRLGSMPIARVGRTNFGNWTLTTDTGKSWFHGKNGVYLPWSGPSIFP